ncbi:MAG: pyridoxamine 5'-phosphate oxidase family protein, partial [Sinomicrobium sp.]|nr:pyridoxamine 5'-phosphate oxidase family protein [Sinomicrobium sp.]
MGKQTDHITPKLQEFIADQHVFFVGTAMKEGRINISPKGMDTLRVTGPNSLVWLNLTGSGNE